MKIYIIKKPRDRDYLKKEDLGQGMKQERFDAEGFALCSYDGCRKIDKNDYKIDRGELYQQICYARMIKLAKEIFAGVYSCVRN